MKVSYQWLSEYVDLTGYSAEELAERLTRSGIEVDAVEDRNQGVSRVVAGFVVERRPHPDADKLSVCTVDAGQGEPLQIVCGAKNVAAGQKVPVALIGAVLPGGFKIKKAKLRGVESQGMICSAKELGLNDKLLPKSSQEGILVLPAEVEVGTDIAELLGLNDKVLDLDLTPNRSDCLSMIGTAYEVAAIVGREVRLPDAPADAEPADTAPAEARASEPPLQVKIDAREQCYRYTARRIDGVTVGASPLWLQNRLMAAGVRPINNIVDVTNYVMLEYGQPLHAFDAEKLSGRQIGVRLATDGEKIVTLDDAERKLEPHMLLITDAEKPIALAGVMGGANSEVVPETRRIVLESAGFAGSSVRRTSRQLGLRSEASLRFEKEVDPQAIVPALNRAASLMAQIAGGRVEEGIFESSSALPEPVSIEIGLDRVNRYLGTTLAADEVGSIFRRLHFPFEETRPGQFHVRVPTRRGDIVRDVDLIEEVARLHGYDRIPTTLMSGETTPGSLTKSQRVRRTLRSLLTDSGLHEVVSYSLGAPRHAEEYPGPFAAARPIALSMPMSEDRSLLRTSLVPHLLDTAAYNRNRHSEGLAIFEIGSVFITAEETLRRLPEERQMLAILLSGNRRETNWAEPTAPYDFYDLKGIAEKIASFLGVGPIRFSPIEADGLHPGRTAEMHLDRGTERVPLGRIGQLHPLLQQRKELPDTYVLEVSLEPLDQAADFKLDYVPLPRYPAIVRDAAFVLDASVRAGDVMEKIRQASGPLLESVQVFDVYAGERLGAGRKSVALSLVYRDPERTLTDEEVGRLHGDIVREVEQTFGAELRK